MVDVKALSAIMYTFHCFTSQRFYEQVKYLQTYRTTALFLQLQRDYKQVVCTIIFVTTYGSMFDAGRRSSK